MKKRQTEMALGRTPSNGREKPRERISFRVDEETRRAMDIAFGSYNKVHKSNVEEAALLIGLKQLGVVNLGTIPPKKLVNPSDV